MMHTIRMHALPLVKLSETAVGPSLAPWHMDTLCKMAPVSTTERL